MELMTDWQTQLIVYLGFISTLNFMIGMIQLITKRRHVLRRGDQEVYLTALGPHEEVALKAYELLEEKRRKVMDGDMVYRAANPLPEFKVEDVLAGVFEEMNTRS